MSELNAKSVDPDQTPQNAASDLGLHCLQMSRFWGARLKWVKDNAFLIIPLIRDSAKRKGEQIVFLFFFLEKLYFNSIF